MKKFILSALLLGTIGCSTVLDLVEKNKEVLIDGTIDRVREHSDDAVDLLVDTIDSLRDDEEEETE